MTPSDTTGWPKRITRAQRNAALAAMDIDTRGRNVYVIEIGLEEVRIRGWAKDDDGNKFRGDDGELAKYGVSIALCDSASERPRAYVCNDGDNHSQPCDCARNPRPTPEPPPDRSWLR